MKVLILNAQEILYRGVVREMVLPGADGELSVMDHHEPMLAALAKGRIRLQPVATELSVRSQGLSKEAGGLEPIAIRQGIVRIQANEAVVLVE